ncbi:MULTISPECIES: hypothetical protein [Bacillus]|uniref:hypothetical protein n=1 Tax=Bacillus TaxID=1386 RepID=UPI00031044AD|nr:MULTISPECIES: hypothetical protein [Bacillus]
MIFLKFDENGIETYRHYKPEMLSKEQLEQGILVQSLPKPSIGQSDILKYDGKKLYYEDMQVQELQKENELMKAQNKAISERADFMEDVVAEMAIAFYP